MMYNKVLGSIFFRLEELNGKENTNYTRIRRKQIKATIKCKIISQCWLLYLNSSKDIYTVV